jgi:class 3 adenylate cyclase/TolB-like protein
MPLEQLEPHPTPQKILRTVLVADLVESVRLMEEDEDDVVRRWRALVERVAADVLPAHGGRLVKSLGDGFMVEFPGVSAAVKSAFAIHRACEPINTGLAPRRQMLLRVGAHVGELVADERDVYGRSVNLAARLTQLAGPGEIVVSADVREQLVPVLDAEIEDLGECFLKHVARPVRAYRVGPPGAAPVIERPRGVAAELRPTVAVIPFAARSIEPEHEVLGEVVADEVITALSRTADLNVISRLSTTAFRGREASVGELAAHLSANYILSGSYRVAGNEIVLVAELAESRSGRALWGARSKADVRALLLGEDEVIDGLVRQVGTAVMSRELERAESQPLPTLETYTLLMGAIALMHRLSPNGFDRARKMLEAVAERVPRHPIPHAWLAEWHVLRVQQGWAAEPGHEALLALDCTRRSLDADPNCSLALAIDGFANTNLLKRFDVAEERYDLALRVNPNEALAWLLKGTLHAFRGEGLEAMEYTEQARRLSPLDPLRYFYDSLAATAALSAGRYERAIELAGSSLRLNRTHTSTWRALAIAQVQLDRLDDARKTVKQLLALEPGLTVKAYQERSPSSSFATGKVWSDALRRAGVPDL